MDRYRTLWLQCGICGEPLKHFWYFTANNEQLFNRMMLEGNRGSSSWHYKVHFVYNGDTPEVYRE